MNYTMQNFLSFLGKVKKLLPLTACLLLVSFIPMKENKTTKAGLKMQEFVINISKYARSFDADFILIPQNGAELAFEKLNPNAKKNMAYLNAIDGIAVEDLFYNQKLKTDNYRLKMFQKIKSDKKVLVSDFISDPKTVEIVEEKNKQEGFLFLPRTASNEHYKEIPAAVPNENAENIIALKDAKNYLYLLNAENFKTKAKYLNAIAATNYDVIVIDLFYDEVPLSAKEVESVRTKANGGKRLVISYINIGAAENWRYYWNGNWILNDPVWIKKKYAGYADEFYVQFWHADWQKIIYGNEQSYVKKIVDSGFDGAFLDNVEAFYFLYNN